MEPQNPVTGNPIQVPEVPPIKPKNGNSVTVIALAIFIILSLGVVVFLYSQNQKLKNMIANFQTPAPTPVSTILPTPNASEPIIASPSANAKIVSPLKITGTVPAGWMFEGVFPIKLLDSNDKLLAQTQGKENVAGAWQSGSAVTFSATITFKPATGSGTLVLQNDNPSGLPANLKTFEIPVKF